MEVGSNQLRQGASDFEKGAADVKKIMWWRNMKLTICIIVLILCLIIALILMFTNN